MADKITDIVDQSAFDQVNKLGASLKDLVKVMEDVIVKGAGMQNVIGSGGGNITKKYTSAMTEMEKVLAQLERTKERISIAQTKENKELQDNKMILTATTKEIKQNIVLNKAQADSTVALRIKMKQLEESFYALSAAQQKGALGKSIASDFSKMHIEVTKAENLFGNFTRNVGNYTNSITGAFKGAFGFLLRWAYILPGLGIAGILGGIGEALLYTADAMGIFSMNAKEAIGYLEQLKDAFSEIDTQIESNSKLMDRYTKWLIAQAKSRGATQEELANIEKKANVDKITFLDLEIKKGNQIVSNYRKLLSLKEAGAVGIKETVDEINKAIDEGVSNVSKLMDNRADLIMENKILDLPDFKKDKTSKPKKEKDKKDKPIDRFSDLQKDLEREKKILETSYKEGSIDFINYQIRLLRISAEFKQKHIDLGKARTKEEIESTIDAGLKIADTYKSALDEIENDINKSFKGITKDIANSVQDNIRNQANVDLSKMLKILKQISNTPINLDLSLGKEKLTAKEVKDNIKSILKNLLELETVLIQIAVNNINIKADAELKAIDATEKAELDSLDRKTLSAKKHEEEKARIESQSEARRKKIERDRITDLRKYAKMQRDINILLAIGNTIAGVTRAFKDYSFPYSLLVAAGIGAAGAVQIAQAYATPLPQYAKGRKGGKGEFAVVNEQGAEIITTKEGHSYIANEGKKGITYLPEHSSVTPHLESIRNAAYVDLATKGVITTDKMQIALINSYEQNTRELKDMKGILKGLGLNVHIHGDYSHIAHVKRSIK